MAQFTLELGEHPAKATRNKFVEVGDKKILKFAAEFQITDGPNKGKKVTWFGGFEGKGDEFTRRAMKTMGWDGKEDPESRVLDKDVMLTIDTEEYQGKSRYVVKYINALDGSDSPSIVMNMQANPARTKAFLKELLAREAASNGTTPARRPAAAPAPAAKPAAGGAEGFTGGADEEIPF